MTQIKMTPGALHAVVTTSGLSSGAPVQVATTYPFTGPGLTMEIWAQTHFGNATVNVGNAEDFDSDGVNNLLEFAFGTAPEDDTSGSGMLQYSGTFARGGTLQASANNAT